MNWQRITPDTKIPVLEPVLFYNMTCDMYNLGYMDEDYPEMIRLNESRLCALKAYTHYWIAQPPKDK